MRQKYIMKPADNFRETELLHGGDPTHPQRSTAADADAAERAGETFTTKPKAFYTDESGFMLCGRCHNSVYAAEICDTPECPLQVPKSIIDADKKYEQDRREAARKLADYSVRKVLENLVELAERQGDDYDKLRDHLLDDIADKILEVMK